MSLIFIFPAKGNYGRRKNFTEFITSTPLGHQANSVESLTGLLGKNPHICDLVLYKHAFFIGNFVPDQLPILWTSSSTLLDEVLESSQGKRKRNFSDGDRLIFIFVTMTKISWLNHGLLPSLILGLGQGTNVISQGCCRDRLPVASRKYMMIQKGIRDMADPCR